MGTGSEPDKLSNPPKSPTGSVPVPFFHGATVTPPENGDRHRRHSGTVGMTKHHGDNYRRRSQSPFSGSV